MSGDYRRRSNEEWQEVTSRKSSQQDSATTKSARMSTDDRNFSYAYIGILCKSSGRIVDRVDISWRGDTYNVWIDEDVGEWVPDCVEEFDYVSEVMAQDNVADRVVEPISNDAREDVLEMGEIRGDDGTGVEASFNIGVDSGLDGNTDANVKVGTSLARKKFRRKALFKNRGEVTGSYERPKKRQRDDNDMFGLDKLIGIVAPPSDHSFCGKVKGSVEQCNFNGDPDTRLMLKFKRLRCVISEWATRCAEKERGERRVLEEEFSHLDSILEVRQLTEEEVWCFEEIKRRLRELDLFHQRDLKQKARTNWATHGDDNTRVVVADRIRKVGAARVLLWEWRRSNVTTEEIQEKQSLEVLLQGVSIEDRFGGYARELNFGLIFMDNMDNSSGDHDHHNTVVGPLESKDVSSGSGSDSYQRVTSINVSHKESETGWSKRAESSAKQAEEKKHMFPMKQILQMETDWYTSPEEAAGGSSSCASDVYRLGVLLFEGASIGTNKTKANVCCVQFPCHSSNFLAYGSADHRVYCYDIRNLRIPLCTLIGHKKTVSNIKFIDSTTLVSSSTDNTLNLWDLSDTASQVLDHSLHSFSGHVNVKNFVGLSVSEGYIATGSETNKVFIYHKAFPMHALSYKFNTTDPISGNETDDDEQFISSVCWHARSSTLVAANSMGYIKVMEMV
ncbi:hypothetical protein L1987_70618 [Smallanthus sonchifolius]|uniref:Uncharacterized protein n=1 Tax=Smallanthus sonchifolius TaxID=185202 RepID=A0ACB9APT3_9ASTR|nr:hypothetical protein L1987_70618 [Smallanthus sonchifolius]